MDEAQTKAIESHMEALCDVVKSDLFLPFLCIKGLLKESECDIISRESTNESKVLKSLRLLIPKEDSWEALVGYLEKHKCLRTVEKLRHSVERHLSLQMGNTSISLNWRQFIRDVADFYLGDYRVVESFDVDGDSDLIESVWVDLQLEGSREPIGHYGEIFAQMRAKNCRLAIVRGQPGSGKTTLAKKIAYDWAKQGTKENFDLILAVPLRVVQSGSDLLQMAVGFYLGSADDNEAKRICADLIREELKILIILDGLDEFQIPPDSPLAKVFAALLSSFNVASYEPIRLEFELMVTSRPFACQLEQLQIAAVTYEVVGLSEGKQVEFVTKRCKKLKGRAKAIEFLNQPNCLNDISQNPFLLTLICFLSDRSQPIPSTLTNLYDTFVHRMLIRSARKHAVGNNFDPINWQQSELLKNLGSLALFGVIRNQFVFTQEEMQMCNVTTEYFHSDLLHYSSDPGRPSFKCNFPHRSIQDFLAAFYAVHYWGDKVLTEATGWPDTVWPPEAIDMFTQMKLGLMMFRVIYSFSQFCRFYLGLISGRNDFVVRSRVVLDEVIRNSAVMRSAVLPFLVIGCDLADCSAEENFVVGEICCDATDYFLDLNRSYPSEQEENTLRLFNNGGAEVRIYSGQSLIDCLSTSFIRGLKLTEIRGTLDSYRVETTNPNHLKVLALDLSDNYIRKRIKTLCMHNRVGRLFVHITSALKQSLVLILQILKQIPLLSSLEIGAPCQEPYDNVIIAIHAKSLDMPRSFSLNCLRTSLGMDKAVKVLQSTTWSRLTVLSVQRWRYSNIFSVTVEAENDLTNADICSLLLAVMY